jgi:hypothetical protein
MGQSSMPGWIKEKPVAARPTLGNPTSAAVSDPGLSFAIST